MAIAHNLQKITGWCRFTTPLNWKHFFVIGSGWLGAITIWLRDVHFRIYTHLSIHLPIFNFRRYSQIHQRPYANGHGGVRKGVGSGQFFGSSTRIPTARQVSADRTRTSTPTSWESEEIGAHDHNMASYSTVGGPSGSGSESSRGSRYADGASAEDAVEDVANARVQKEVEPNYQRAEFTAWASVVDQ